MLLPTIRMSPAAHSAEVRAALDMAAASAEAARLHAIIKDLEHDKMVAAINTEHDKVVAAQAADNSQLRRDMEHMHAIHEQRAQYELEAALMQSRLAAAPTTLPPPDVPDVDGPAPVAAALTKLIISQLALNNPPAAILANKLAAAANVDRISEIVLRLMQGLHIVSGGAALKVACAILFQLPGLSDMVNTKDVAYQNAMDILSACAHHGAAEDLDDTSSTSGSDAPDGNLIEERDDIFGDDDTARRIYRCLVHYLSGGTGGVPHPGMANWGPMSLHLHGYLLPLLDDGPNHKLAMRQPSFLEVVQQLLLRAKHSVGTRLERDIGIVVNQVAYTNTAGTFEGIMPTDILLAYADDIERRMLSMEALHKHPMALVLSMAEKSLPVGAHGSAVQAMLTKLRRKMNVAAAKKPTLPKILAIIDRTIKQLGSVEPAGDLSAPVPEAIIRPAPGAASALAAAAGAIQPGGGKGRGKGKGPYRQPGAPPTTEAAPIEPTGEGPPMPPGQRMCSQGSNCDGFGTMKGCDKWHDPKAVQFIRDQHGSNFISKQTRRLVLDLRQAERAAALVPPTAPQPAAPLPVTTAESAPATRAQKAVEHMARLNEATQSYSGCAINVPIAPVHAEPSPVDRNSGSVGAAGEPDTILPIPPIAADSRRQAPSIHPARTSIERTAEPIPTMLGVSRPVHEHERIERSKRIATHAKPACHNRFRALRDATSDDFRPQPKIQCHSEFPPLPAPRQPSPAEAMRHKASPQADCRDASSARGCMQSPAAPPKAEPNGCAFNVLVKSEFALGMLTTTGDAGKPTIRQMEPAFLSKEHTANVAAEYDQMRSAARIECAAWLDADLAAKSAYLAAHDGLTPHAYLDLKCGIYADFFEAACEATQQQRIDEASELEIAHMLSDENMAGYFVDYKRWLVNAHVDYKEWKEGDEASRQRYCADHHGRNAQQHHHFMATKYANFFEAVIAAMPAERQLAMAANVRALGVLAILDSGSTEFYADGTGQVLQPCKLITAQQAGGTDMRTDQEWAFELFVEDHKGQVYRLHSPSRHVPYLGGPMPFCIIPPCPILAAGGVWNNSGLHGSYIRVAMPGADSRDPRLSGKIPISWELGVSTFIPVPEHLRTKGEIISICISGKAARK
jgi:hypothetical protein